MDTVGSESKTPQGAPWLWPWQALSSQLAALAPQSLWQPILPGWTVGNVITVTERNSSSPDTERDILAEQSYGRQLGRLMDAVAVLIEERSPDLPRIKAFDELLELKRSVDEIKRRSALSRVKRLEAELATLKRERPNDYRRIAAALAQDAQQT